MNNINFLIPMFCILLGMTVVPMSGLGEETQSGAESGEGFERAMFAGGCFWCMEKPFEKLDGVISVTSGYAGGTTVDPTYDNYAAGGHIEVVQIRYDPVKVSYERLLDVFWRQIDPTDDGGQFVDRGHAYTTAIFHYDAKQRQLAEQSRQELVDMNLFSEPIVTPIEPAPAFYPAEEYHQDYYRKNPVRYWFYRLNSGRDRFLDRIWGEGNH